MKHDSTGHAGPGSRRSGRIVTYLLVLLFACMGVPVYLWGQRPESPSEETTCAAKVRIPLSVADKVSAKHDILTSENLDRAVRKVTGLSGEDAPEPGEAAQQVRERLDVSVTTVKRVNRPPVLQVAITYSAPEDAERGARLVNELARQYAQDQRARLVAAAGKSHEEARRAADSAQKKLFEAQAQFDAFLDNYFRGDGERQNSPAKNTAQAKSGPDAKADGAASVKKAENPERVKTQRQLDDLRRHRERLLADRTPMHPSVRSADEEIIELEKRLAAIPHELVPAPGDLSEELKPMLGLPPVPPGPVDPRPTPEPISEPNELARPPVLRPETVKTYTQRRDKLVHAREEYEKRAAVDREKWEMRYRLPQIEVELARPATPKEPPKAQPSLLFISSLVGLAGAMGMVMLSMGVGGEPILSTEAQARRVLPVQVVGTVPPADRSTGMPRSRRRPDGWILAVCGVLLLLLCLGMVLSALWGVQLG
jgi:hypothetical protein